MFFKIVRRVLGAFILLGDRLSRPAPVRRSPQEQEKVDAQTRGYSLYQFHACPFCVKVRRSIHRLGLNIELRDAKTEGPYRAELLSGGGKIKVPCLRIDAEDGSARWMYESDDIIAYLESRFAPAHHNNHG